MENKQMILLYQSTGLNSFTNYTHMSENITHRYSDQELAEFKALLDQKLAKANNELNYMRQQIIEINQNGADSQGGDWSDDSSIHTELEMLNQMVSRQQQFIRNLNNAFQRIKNKTYGICLVSGKLIDKKRLMLVPHATKSIAVKEAVQKGPSRRTEKTNERRKSAPKKIITKVLKTTARKTESGVVNTPDWETEEDFNDVPAYENPIMDLDLKGLEEE